MTDQPTPEDSLDELYDVLSNGRRRFVLRYLRDRTDPVPSGRLAALLASRERSGADGDEADVRRVEVSLRHVHLPRLDDAGLVVYDHERGVVAAPSSHERLARSVRRTERFSRVPDDTDEAA